MELIDAVTAVGKPTVAVVSMGRPQGLATVIDRLPAVLTAYYGGPRQGARDRPPRSSASRTPLFAFGHGLSYTTFEYSPLMLESDTVDVNGELRLSLTVTNTGKRRGTEVVQLYAADTATGVTLPAQQLVGFARLDLEPGASETVGFVVPMSLLAYTGLSGELVMEPGPVELSVGSSSSDIRSTAKFTVTGKTRAIQGEDRAFLSEATVGSSNITLH